MAKTIISTPSAPAAIGTYSQAVKVGDTVYLSGQIGLDPLSMQMVDGIDAQIVRVFENLKAVAEAHALVRAMLVERLGAVGGKIRILYGGSVKPGNAGQLLGIDNVDGVLVGGASLEAGSFAAIVTA